MAKPRTLRRSTAIWTAVVAVILLLAIWGLPALARSQVGGTVRDSQTGQPIAHALVVVARRGSTLHGASARRAQIAETQTDSQGRFAATLRSKNLQLLSHSYHLIVIAHGYQPLSSRLSDPVFDEGLPSPIYQLNHGNFEVKLHAQQSLEVPEALARVRSDLYYLYFAISPVCVTREVPRLWAYLTSAGIFKSVDASSDEQEEQGKYCEI